MCNRRAELLVPALVYFLGQRRDAMAAVIVGVMGPGEDANPEDKRLAYEIGYLIARQGWILLTGGRNVGVMDAAGRGAKDADGLVIGILPGINDTGMSSAVDIPVITGMNEARNCINVLSCRLLFFIGMNPGTANELALALKYQKPAILIRQDKDIARAFGILGNSTPHEADNATAAMELGARILALPL
jgi:uncharacterized protein (TIGR00725 family)